MIENMDDILVGIAAISTYAVYWFKLHGEMTNAVSVLASDI